MPEIIIKWKLKHGKTRSEIEQNLLKEGWGSSLTEEQLDKCSFLEKKWKDQTGAEYSRIKTKDIYKVK